MKKKGGGQMKKLGLRMFILLALLLVFTLLFSPCIEPATAEQKELIVGGVFGLSGPGSESFSRIYDGVKAGAAWINDKGGLNIKGERYLIKTLGEDSKMSPDGMIAAANKLVFQDKVKFMIQGVPIPPFKAAMIKILEDNKVLSVQPDGIGVNAEFSPQISYSFGTMTARSAYDVGWANFVKHYPKAKTIVIVAPEDPATIEDAQHLGNAANVHGLKVIGEEHYPFGTADFYPMWTKIMTLKPDVLASSAGLPEWIGGVVKQGRELGFQGSFCLLMLGADPNVIVKIAGDKYATDVFAANFDYTSEKMPPMVKEMARVIKQKIGAEITADSFMSFEAIWVLAQAIQYAQSIDPTVVKNAFEKMAKFDMATGPGKLAGEKTYGIKRIAIRSIPLIKIMNGKIEQLGWFDPVLP
jgi:branched-chain amino acid transport system substrate-binding protein